MFDALRAERLGDADRPLAADAGAGRGVLREDAAGGNVAGVEAVLQVELQAFAAGGFAGVGDGEAGERGNDCLAAVDGEAHGDEGRDKRDGDHREGAQKECKNALHCRYPPPKVYVG